MSHENSPPAANTESGGREMPPEKLPIWKTALFSGVTTVAFFVVAEFVLFLIGVEPIRYEEDPYVGFSSYAPLFVEERDSDGEVRWVTARNKLKFFQEQRFPNKKSTSAYRIFCLGGSTTYGRPYSDPTSFCGWLRAFLPRVDPSRDWEVINAGGVSYASYRVSVLMEELVRYKPDLFIIYTGHNEFLERRTYSRLIKTPRALRGVGFLAGQTRIYAALKEILEKFTRPPKIEENSDRLLSGEVETILEKSVGPSAYHRDDDFQERVIEHFQFNLHRMLKIARSGGAEVTLIKPASNLRHSSPFKSEHRSGLGEVEGARWEMHFEGARVACKEGSWEEALGEVDLAAAIDDRYAHLHYLRGQVMWELERYDEARAAFVRARDEDICPLRALTRIQDMVPQVAAEHRVPLVDFESLFASSAERGIPGESLFLDHVHPTIAGNRMLALSIVEKMRVEGIVRPVDSWGDAAIAEIVADVESRLDQPAHGKALRNLARILRWAGKDGEAYRLATQATEKVPLDAEANFLAGATALEVNRVDEAIKHLQRALRINPEIEEAHFALGQALSLKGRSPEAIVHYEKALEHKDDFVEAHNNLGNELSGIGKIEEAIRHYRESLRFDPEYADGHHNLGLALAAKGSLSEAIASFREAIRIRPDYAQAYSNLGGVFEAQDQLEVAVEHYEKALAIDPDIFEAQLNLGIALSALEKPDEALGALREALRIRPRDPQAHHVLGIELSAGGDAEGAIGHFRKALSLKPDYVDARFDLGNELFALGRIDLAVKEYREIVKNHPDLALPHYRLGLALQTIDLPREAIRYFDEALSLKPDWHTSMIAKARILASYPDPSLHDVDKAIELASRAAELTGFNDADVLSTLAEIYYVGGLSAEAVDTAVKALAVVSSGGDSGLANHIREQLERYNN